MRHAGIGLRHPHYAALLQQPPALAFVEVHAENFFGDGGAALAVLHEARTHWPVSLHGVGLALGSAAGVDPWHLERLARLAERIEPLLVSDHASFARAPRHDGGPVLHGSDLLPIAFTDASLAILARNVQQVQERLSQPLLVENLSAYLHWADDAIAEPQFFNALCRSTGCGLLLDVNNLVVNALNALPRESSAPADGADAPPGVVDHARAERAVAAACRWIDALDAGVVGEIHLAGFDAGGDIVIDDHGSRVHGAVWQVYRHAIARCGARLTLVEWDTAIPPLPVLLAEAAAAERALTEAVLGMAA
jgi:uncharacterized protein (UPF0276 family)